MFLRFRKQLTTIQFCKIPDIGLIRRFQFKLTDVCVMIEEDMTQGKINVLEGLLKSFEEDKWLVWYFKEPQRTGLWDGIKYIYIKIVWIHGNQVFSFPNFEWRFFSVMVAINFAHLLFLKLTYLMFKEPLMVFMATRNRRKRRKCFNPPDSNFLVSNQRIKGAGQTHIYPT